MNAHSPLICFYFQVHQPYRLRDLRIVELGRGDTQYFDAEKNRAVFRKVAEKCYLPANAVMLELLERHPEFRISYSLSGAFLDQCEEYGPDVLASFQALGRTGRVEFLAETDMHSLSSIVSSEEFAEQVRLHTMKIKRLFGVTPSVFRNTELIYSNEIAQMVHGMGYTGMLAEGADHVLRGRNPNLPYTSPTFPLPQQTLQAIDRHRVLPKTDRPLTVLLKNYRLSDDVAFRFSDRSWVGFPLTAEKFCHWLKGNCGHSINLFMDYETFGEHQWADTGIFDFLRTFPAMWIAQGGFFATPSETIRHWADRPLELLDVHVPMSWADMERDLSAWQGNRIQNAALASLFALEDPVKRMNDKRLLDDWRKLTTSDHFYYMCTKYWSDGDVHKYFSPYDSPYEAYRRFSHAVHDLKHRVQKVPVRPEEEQPRTDRDNLLLTIIAFMQKPRSLKKHRRSPNS